MFFRQILVEIQKNVDNNELIKTLTWNSYFVDIFSDNLESYY